MAIEAVAGRPGASSPSRLEAADKVTGRARYTTDVALPGQLVAGIVRSRHASGRVKDIDIDAARRLPGVVAVLTADDTHDFFWYEEQAPLFAGRVRFVGDEIAAVAAESVETLADAMRAIAVRYDVEACVIDIDSARHAAAPRVHEHAESNLAGPAETYSRGDIEAGIAAADAVVAESFTTPAAMHNALEPHACNAAWLDGELNLWVSTQGIHAVRKDIARKLGLAEERVRVIAEHIGGGFGAKQVAWKEAMIAALLASASGRPVRVVLDRRAENLAAGHRNATRQHVKLAATRDGRLTAIDVTAEVDVGAYTIDGERSEVVGCYREHYLCPNVRTEQLRIYTNTGPAVAFRAPGYVEGHFALEQALDELARVLAIDPIELRERNLSAINQTDGRRFSSPQALQRCFDRIRETRGAGPAERPIASRRSRRGCRRGTGFAAAIWLAGGPNPPARATAELGADGTTVIRTGTQDIGTGTRTALAQIAAEEIGVALERVRIHLGDTACGLEAPTSSGSATLATLGPAVRDAAAALRRALASEGTPRSPRDSRRRVVAEGAAAKPPGDVAVRTFAAVLAEIELDVATGEVVPIRIVCAPDCGRIVNLKLTDSQVIGAVMQGLGFALMEQRVLDRTTGAVLNANLEDYLIPTLIDTPEILHAAVDLPDFAVNDLGIKGIGEPPIIAVAPAIANAVRDAIGVRIGDLPLSPARLIASLAGRAGP